jgi:uncharacterized protein (DUF1330 family)
MAKGYWIGRVDVNNEEGYKPYAAANPAIFKKFGGKFVVRAGKFDDDVARAAGAFRIVELPGTHDELAAELLEDRGIRRRIGLVAVVVVHIDARDPVTFRHVMSPF